MPSSAITYRILPSGFCLRTLSLTSLVSAASIVTSLSRPSSEIAIRTLRPNGEAGEERRMIIAAPLTLLILFAGAHFCGSTFCGGTLLQEYIARRSATVQRSAGRPHGISRRVALPHDAATSPYP